MKKLFYKNGDPAVYRYFTEATLKHMTAQEKAMWSPHSDNDPAPISQDVIDFQKKSNEYDNRIAELEAENKALKEANEVVFKTKKAPVVEPETDADAEKTALRDELRRLGVKFAPNTGIPKLREKLKEAQNADNRE